MVNGHEVNEVDGELYAHKCDVMATIGNGTIDNGQEDRRVLCNRCVFDLIAFLVMEAQDGKLAEVKPAVVVVAEPVVNHPINCSAELQLMPRALSCIWRLMVWEDSALLLIWKA